MSVTPPIIEGVDLKQLSRGKDIEITIDRCISMLRNIDDNIYRRINVPIIWEDLEQKVRNMIETTREESNKLLEDFNNLGEAVANADMIDRRLNTLENSLNEISERTTLDNLSSRLGIADIISDLENIKLNYSKIGHKHSIYDITGIDVISKLLFDDLTLYVDENLGTGTIFDNGSNTKPFKHLFQAIDFLKNTYSSIFSNVTVVCNPILENNNNEVEITDFSSLVGNGNITIKSFNWSNPFKVKPLLTDCNLRITFNRVDVHLINSEDCNSPVKLENCRISFTELMLKNVLLILKNCTSNVSETAIINLNNRAFIIVDEGDFNINNTIVNTDLSSMWLPNDNNISSIKEITDRLVSLESKLQEVDTSNDISNTISQLQQDLASYGNLSSLTEDINNHINNNLIHITQETVDKINQLSNLSHITENISGNNNEKCSLENEEVSITLSNNPSNKFPVKMILYGLTFYNGANFDLENNVIKFNIEEGFDLNNAEFIVEYVTENNN